MMPSNCKLFYRELNDLVREGLVRFEYDPMFGGTAMKYYSPTGEWYTSTKDRPEMRVRFGQQVVVVRDTANPLSLGYIFNFAKRPVVDDWDITHHPYMFEYRN